MEHLDPEETISSATPPARARANRREAIQVLAITRDGRQADATCVFTRESNGDIVFGETFQNVAGQANLLEPIRRKWSKS